MTYEEEIHAPEKPRRTNESLAGDFRYLQITGREGLERGTNGYDCLLSA